MFNKLKQFKQVRDQAKTVNSRLKEIVVHGQADHGKIQVVADGSMEILGVEIDPDHLRTERREELQKHVAEAVNDALKKAQAEMGKAMREMKDLNLPSPFG